MNTKSLLLHLMRKDLGALRGPWIMVWALILIVAFLPVGGGTQVVNTVGLLPIPSFILLFLVQTMLLQLDPARGAEDFLNTRPVARKTIAFEKVALFWLVGVLPMLAAEMIQIARAQIDLPGVGWRWLLLQCFLSYLGIAGVVAVVSVFTKTIPQFISTVAGLFISLLIFFAIFPKFEFPPRLPHDNNLETTHRYLLFALLGVAGYTAVAARYSKQGWKTIGCIVIVAASLILACIRFWTVSAIPPALARVAGPSESKEFLDQIVVHWSSSGPMPLKTKHQDGDFTQLSIDYTVENLPPLYFAEDRKCFSTLKISADQKFGEFGIETWVEYPREIPAQSLATLLGVPITVEKAMSGPRSFTEIPLISHTADQSAHLFGGMRLNLSPGIRAEKLSGHVDFSVYKPVIVAELPLTPGAAYAENGFRIEVIQAIKRGAFLHVEFNRIGLRPWITSLRYGSTSYPEHLPQDLLLCVTNPVSKEFLFGLGVSQDTTLHAGDSLNHTMMADVDVRRLTIRCRAPKAFETDPSINPAWLADVRIHVIQLRAVGKFTRPFEFTDVPLEIEKK